MKTLLLTVFFLYILINVAKADCQLTLNLFSLDDTTHLIAVVRSRLSPGENLLGLEAGENVVFYTLSQQGEQSAMQRLTGKVVLKCHDLPIELNAFLAPPGSFLSGKMVKK